MNGFAFYGVLIPFLVILLLFPDGTLMSPRWRIVLGGILVGGGLLILSVMVSPGPLGVTDLDNPVGIEALGGVTPIVNIIGGVVLIASALATVIGVVGAVPASARLGTPADPTARRGSPRSPWC